MPPPSFLSPKIAFSHLYNKKVNHAIYSGQIIGYTAYKEVEEE